MDKDVLAFQQWQQMRGGGGTPAYVKKWTTPVVAPGPQRGKGGFATSLISEGGGMAGAAGGAALGTAIAPGVGTLLGAIIGGFAGGTGGRLAENKIRDNEFRPGQALKEGALMGALSGLGTGWQVAKGAKALTGVGGLKGVQLARHAGPEAFKGVLKGGAGAVTGGVDDVTKAAKLTGGRNAATRIGQNAYRTTLGIDDIIMPAKQKPFSVFGADDLVNEARKIGLKGTPKAMQRQVNTQYQFLTNQIDDILGKSKGSTTVTKMLTKANKEVASKLPLRIDGVPVRSELIRSMNQLKALSTGGKINAKALHAFKNNLSVDSAFTKLKAGGNLTAKETVDLALWRQADDWIKQLAPAAKNLTVRQSKLYDLAHGLGKMTRTPGEAQGIGQLLIRGAAPVARSGQNLIGRSLLTAGGAQTATGSMIPAGVRGAVGQGVRQGVYQAPSNLIEALSGATPPSEAPQGFEDQLDSGITDRLGGMGATTPQAQGMTLVEALQQAQQLLGPNESPSSYLSYAKAIMDSSGGGAGGGANTTKITGQQYALAQRGASSLQQLNELLQQDPGVLNRSATPGRKLPIVGGFISNAAGTGDFDAIGYNIASSLLRIETGAQANESEIRNLQSQLMPRAGDSPQTVQRKMEQLNLAFSNILSMANNGGASSPGYEETQQYQTGGF